MIKYLLTTVWDHKQAYKIVRLTAFLTHKPNNINYILYVKKMGVGDPACPSHVTLGRRYKALTPKLQTFTEYVATSQFAKAAGFLQEVVYEDKSLFKAAGPVWHQKDHLPKNLRGVDKTATWSKSGYHGWVYGYGLHLTSIRNGFPMMFHVLPANVNERKVLDTKKDRLIEKGVRCIIADKGYIDKKRQVAFAKDDVILLTPKTTLLEVSAFLGAGPLYTATQVATWQAARKTAIESVFDLLSRLLSITGRINLYRCEVWRMFPPFWASASCCCSSQC